ncbi:MAG: hypothetical protein QOH93_2791 [Chloroflexia bacterium]|nr:hypothetical protein [Chloroflexia bacterium]
MQISDSPYQSEHKLTPRGPILIVEDDTVIREVICEVLEDAGYEVECAAGGYEGLLKVLDVNPALVLLDMRMPGVDGWSFATKVKSTHPLVPIVVMTAASDPKNWAETIQANAYLAKPFDVDDLVAIVERFAC